jgi:hypothetical protein
MAHPIPSSDRGDFTSTSDQITKCIEYHIKHQQHNQHAYQNQASTTTEHN